MQVRVTRDDVCAADGDLGPHTLTVVESDTLESIVTALLRVYDLPRIEGGDATWCLVSRSPVAVVAQQWAAPRMVSWQVSPISSCKMEGKVLCVHFSYLAQINPELALEVLRRTARSTE